jgi:hypothetical protein
MRRRKRSRASRLVAARIGALLGGVLLRGIGAWFDNLVAGITAGLPLGSIVGYGLEAGTIHGLAITNGPAYRAPATRVVGVYLHGTDVLIDVQRAHAPALVSFGALTELPSVPGFVVMKLIQDAQNAPQVRDALRLVAPRPFVWPGAADCQRAPTDFAAFHVSQGLGLLDALIGACAVGLPADQCNFSVKHYR